MREMSGADGTKMPVLCDDGRKFPVAACLQGFIDEQVLQMITKTGSTQTAADSLPAAFDRSWMQSHDPD